MARKSSAKRQRPKRRQPTPRRHRRVLKNTTYLISKKCSDSLFLIRPSKEINQILLFLLILKALRYGILIHGFCFMSNHLHLLVTDVEGRLPAFMREFLGESSKAIQCLTKDDRPVWSRKRYSAVALLDLDAAERKLVYTLLNPSRAGLTRPQDWPGLTSAGMSFGEVLKAERPEVYFSSKRPSEVRTVLQPVALSFGGSLEESSARINDRMASELESCERRMKAKKKRYLGKKRVKAASRERKGRKKISRINPRFATLNRELETQAIASYRRFEQDHERARARYISGQKGVVFPAGTYGFVVVLGARVSCEEVA